MTEYDWTINEDALDELPENWADEFARKVNDQNVWLGYDVTLDAGYLWFTANQSNAVHIPIYDDVEIVIDDVTNEIIGVVIHHFRAMADLVMPLSERMLIAAGKMRPPQMEDDVPMQPYKDLAKKPQGRDLIRTFAHVNASPAPAFAD